MQLKKHFTYQTKNLINNKTYIGVHSTCDPNDSYIGHGIYRQSDAERMKRSGCKSLFVLAVCKYGYENFKKEIMCFFDSKEEALEEERWIVDDNYVKKNSNYNTCIGGLGKNSALSETHKKTLVELSSKEYVVSNLLTRQFWIIKNLSQFERDMFYEFNHKNDGKKIQSKLNAVAVGKTLLYKNKWWACRLDEWDGKIPFVESLIEKRKQLRKPLFDSVYLSNKKRAKKYIFINPEGNVVRVNNLPSFCKENKLDPTCMSRVANKKASHHKNWTLYVS